MRSYYVYILASKKNGTLYIGVTSDLYYRVLQHKEGKVDGFTKRYHVHQLMYFEEFEFIEEAILRETQLKWWKRQWKIEMIENGNPEWRDLWEDFA